MDKFSSHSETTSPSNRGWGTDPLEMRPAGVRVCEPRIALSASVAAELLLSTFDGAFDGTDQDQPTDQDWLLEQASQVREKYGVGGSGQTIAVIDSGIAWDHLALGGGFGPGYRVVGGWDFAENDDNPYDDGPAGFHGSHVSGLIAGQTADFAGVSPDADLVALRVFDDSGSGSLDAIESALAWVHENRQAFAHPITTVNLSLGAILTDANAQMVIAQLGDELQQLYGDGIFVAAAAGNQFDAAHPDRLTHPASSEWVTAVGSIDADGSLSRFSQREPGILTAPGRGVVSSVPDHVLGWDGRVDDFIAANGTSMASPQIAGAAALVRQAMLMADPGADVGPEAIAEHLRQTAVAEVDAVTGQAYYAVHLRNAVDALLGGVDRESDDAGEDVASHLPDGIAIADGRLQVTGTSGTDAIHVDFSEGLRIDVNGANYSLSSDELAAIAHIEIDASAGNDSLHIVGSSRAERLTLHAPAADREAVNELIAGERAARILGIENVRFDGGGGSDRATLFDSTQKDHLEARPGQATLSGVGYTYRVENVPRIYVHATAGGEDTAFLHDSQRDDVLAVRPQFTSLRGDGHFNLAYGFERVYAYATAGGDDVASLYDSEGDDRMTASAASAFISGPGYYASARHFESVAAHATAGGNDRATLYAADGEADWHRTGDLVQVNLPQEDPSSAPQSRIARGFERVETYVAGQPLAVAPLSWGNSLAGELENLSHQRDETPVLRSELLEQAANDFGQLSMPPGSEPFWMDDLASRADSQARSESRVLADLFAELDELA